MTEIIKVRLSIKNINLNIFDLLNIKYFYDNEKIKYLISNNLLI